MRTICFAVALLVPIAWLGGCAAAPGVAAGVGAGLLGRGLDAGGRALDAVDDYATEGVARRREIRVWIKEAENEECKALPPAERRECWIGYYPTLRDIRLGVRGKPLEADNADE